MENHRHNDTDILESALSELRRQGESLGPSPQALTRTREALASARRKQPGLHLVERIRHMKNWKKSLAIAAAAAVVIAAVAVWMHMPRGSVPSFTGITFADVQRQMRNIKTMSCVISVSGPTGGTSTVTTTTKDENGNIIKKTETVSMGPKSENCSIKLRMSQKEPGFFRVEMLENSMQPNLAGMYTVTDTQTGKEITFFPKHKIYQVRDSDSAGLEGLGSMLETCRKMIEVGEATSLPEEKTIDGRKVKGYEIKMDNMKGGVWVDAKTGEPVQIIAPASINNPASEPKPEDFGKGIISNIRINEPLDDSLFSMDIPEGYKNIEDDPAAFMRAFGLPSEPEK